ncbi:MAG: EamA family transporter [Sphaerospermopsis sp. SIO1G2]|nr:EamA family transporter [Sphaerospermopsis sp. SIO1G2]
MAMEVKHMMQAVLVAACWGGNFIAAAIVLDVFPPLWLLAVRFAIVAALLLPFFPRPVGRIKDIALLSLLLGTLHFSLMFGSIALGLDVSSAVISSQLGVPFSCLLGSIFFKDTIGRWRAGGMLISFIGVIIIAGSPAITEHYGPFMLACVGALAWAAGNIYIKKFDGANILGVLAWLSLFAFPQLALLSLLFESGQMAMLAHASLEIWAAFAYTVAISTLLAYGLWYRLMQRFPVSQVVPYSLLVPVFGLSFAQWFFAEPLTWQFLLGGAFTVTGVAVIVFRKPVHLNAGKGQ